MPWQTKENNNRRNSFRQTIVLCSAYRNTWLPSVIGATYVTSSWYFVFPMAILSVAIVGPFESLAISFRWWLVGRFVMIYTTWSRTALNLRPKPKANNSNCIKPKSSNPPKERWLLFRRFERLVGDRLMGCSCESFKMYHGDDAVVRKAKKC